MPVSKSKKKKNQKREAIFYLILGTLLISLFVGYRLNRARILSFDRAPQAVTASTLGKPIQLEIPSLNIDLSVEEAVIKDGVWQISPKNVSHLATSAVPGQGGNIVVYGHNKASILGRLRSIKEGEKIYLKNQTGEIFPYVVEKTVIVNPDDIQYVEKKNEEVLTLYTCTGLFDSQRLVVVAKPLKSS